MMASWFVVFVLIADIEEKYRELKQMAEVSVLRRERNFIEHISGFKSVSLPLATLAYTVTSIHKQQY
jgi:hypothetical protein